MTVNRFKPVASVAISLSENGGYVRYEDYMALMDELETEKKQREGAFVACNRWHDKFRESETKLEAAEKRIAELEEIATDYALKFQKAQDALKYAALLHNAKTEKD